MRYNTSKVGMPKRNKRTSSFFLVASIGLVVFLLVALGREYVGNLQIQYEIKQREKEVAELQGQQLQTLDLIDSLSSEYYLEREGRVKQGLTKQGEEVIVIAGDDIGVIEEEAPYGIERVDQVSTAQRWFYYFFDQERFDYLRTL